MPSRVLFFFASVTSIIPKNSTMFPFILLIHELLISAFFLLQLLPTGHSSSTATIVSAVRLGPDTTFGASYCRRAAFAILARLPFFSLSEERRNLCAVGGVFMRNGGERGKVEWAYWRVCILAEAEKEGVSWDMEPRGDACAVRGGACWY